MISKPVREKNTTKQKKDQMIRRGNLQINYRLPVNSNVIIFTHNQRNINQNNEMMFFSIILAKTTKFEREPCKFKNFSGKSKLEKTNLAFGGQCSNNYQCGEHIHPLQKCSNKYLRRVIVVY